MSEPDSFLDEVTEEVRRDQLVAWLRRNAVWIAAAVIVIVGGAAFLEWQRASERAAAQARGDALNAALAGASPEARLDALSALSFDGAEGAAFLDMQRANAVLEAGDRAAALDILQGIAARGDVSEAMRNVARLKFAAAGSGTLDASAREEVLIPMLAEGHAMRGLALEQRAMIRLESGNLDGAIEDLMAASDDERAPAALRDRAGQILAIIAPAGEAADG